MTGPRPAYPECSVPFVWPTVGVRTWVAPRLSYFGDECSANGDVGHRHRCPVGVYSIGGRVYGCDCGCHDERRVKLAGPKR